MLKRRLAWGLWMLAVCALWFFENNGGTRAVLLASLLLPFLSLLCAFGLSCCASCSLQAPASAEEKAPVSCQCVYSFPGWFWRFLPASCSAVIETRNQWTGETASLRVPCFPYGSGSFTLSSSQGGRITLRLTRLEFQDVFGLFRLRKSAASEISVLIFPHLFPVTVEKAEAGSNAVSESGRVSADPFDPFLSGDAGGNELRDYLPGDPIRQIHWKLSSKLDQLMVRLPEEAPEEDPVLVLDAIGPPPDDVSFSGALLTAFLSLSCALAHLGLVHRVFWFDPENSVWQSSCVRTFSSFAGMRESLLATAAFCPEVDEALPFPAFSSEAWKPAIVFSLHPDLPAAGLLPAGCQTLVLPSSLPEFSAPPGVRVVTLSPENAVFSL